MDANFSPPEDRAWTFVTNHFLVLLCVARNPDVRVRDIANMVGITERATQTMLSDLEQAGYLDRTRVGRRNHYQVRWTANFRHPLVRPSRIGDVLEALAPTQMLTAASPTRHV